MRKIFATILLSSLALLGCPKAGADVVSLEKAKAAARQYFNDGAVTRAGAVEPVLVWSYNQATKGPYAPAFYVFNNPQGGWMIISGEDACHAILAHSDKGSFDPQTLPENTAWWLDGYAEQIEWARTNFLSQDSRTAAEWNNLLSGNIRKAQTTVELATPSWGQRAPFNYYCPFYYKDAKYYYCPCGCVATALAEVMYYHAKTRNLRLPVRGHGTVGGYTAEKTIYFRDSSLITTFETVNLDAQDDYDWDNMMDYYNVNTPFADYTSAQRKAISRLIYHCGLMSEMQWGQSGSGAHETKAAMALVRNMGYNPDLYVAYRSAYTESEWIRLLQSEIAAYRPVIMGGDSSGAHEFVADGYNTDDQLRMNWGWYGDNNGWYAVSAFTPSSSDYRLSITAIIGAYPVEQPTYEPTSPEILRIQGFSMKTDNTTTPSGGNPYGNYTVSLRIANSARDTFAGDIRLYVYDYKDSVRYISSSQKINTKIAPASSNGWSSWSGNYRGFAPTYRPPLGAKIRITYVAEGGTAESSKPIFAKTTYRGCNNNIPVYDAPFIPVKDDGIYQVGDYFDFVIINSRTVPDDMAVVWTFDGASVTLDEKTKQATRVLDVAGEHTIKAVVTIGGITETLVQVIKVQ